MTNEELYKNALEAIEKLFGDMSVSQQKARENLEDLLDEIKIMLEGMETK